MRLPLACAALALACTRAPAAPPRPASLAALARLRDALAGGGDLARAADPEALDRAELVERIAHLHDIQEGHEVTGATEAGLRRALDDIAGRSRGAALRRRFEPARALLGDGRCAEVARAPLPDALAAVPAPRPTWPAFVDAEVRAPLARRAAGARAGDFRCEGGARAFRAVFLPRDPPDGTLVVASVTPL